MPRLTLFSGDRPRGAGNGARRGAAQFHQSHLQLVNQKLSEQVQRLAETEHRLSAIIDIGRRFSFERDPRQVLQQVCTSARDITLAKYAVLALISDDRTRVEAVLTSGVDPGRLTGVLLAVPTADVLLQMLARRRPGSAGAR